MRNSTLLCWRDLLGIACGSNFWSSEDIVKASFHYAESRQKITYGVNHNENLKKNL